MTSDDFPWWHTSPVAETAVCGICGAVVPYDWGTEHVAFHQRLEDLHR